MSVATDDFPNEKATSEANAGERWHEAFSRDEIQNLVRMSDWKSYRTLLATWAMTFAAMAMAATWTNPLTLLLALVIIGTRQLGLAVIMHEAAHRSFLSNKASNDAVASWLACYPIWSDLHSYRPYHLRHHAKTWTDEDPDRHLALPFPITRESFGRKVLRDLSGRTGFKFARFAIRRDISGEGSLLERLRGGLRNRNFRGMLITNTILLVGLALTGHAWLYLLWVGSYLTTNTLVTRIRAIAEHSSPGDIANPFQNTRTTLASGWERLFIAPNRVNYHLEHHLLMTVPHYNLPRMHAMLGERGLLEDALVAPGYASVLKAATAATPPASSAA
jgi:fatty acid desaturase